MEALPDGAGPLHQTSQRGSRHGPAVLTTHVLPMMDSKRGHVEVGCARVHTHTHTHTHTHVYACVCARESMSARPRAPSTHSWTYWMDLQLLS